MSLWKKIYYRVKSVPEQYPLAVVAMITLTIVGFIMVYTDMRDAEQYTRIIMTFVTLFLVSISGELWSHAQDHTQKLRALTQLSIVVFVGAYALLLPKDFNQAPFDTIIVHVLWYICFFTILFVAAFFGRKNVKNNSIYGHTAVMLLAIFIGVIFAQVAFSLGALFLWSLDALFGVAIEKGFGYWWVITATLIGPLMALSRLPEKTTFTLAEKLPKVVHILVQYIIMPFVILYFIVLYAYTGKIVFLWTWPDGVVSWMIIAFSIIGWGVYIIIFPWRNTSKIFHIFSHFFPWIALPQIIMLFVALWWRVSAYGITVNRYFVALFGLWLLFVAAYFIMVHRKKLIVFLASFLVCTFLASFGPWGAFAISEQSQSNRLRALLMEHQIISENGHMQKSDRKSMDQDIQNNIISTMQYLEKTHGTDSLQKSIPIAYEETYKSEKCFDICTNLDLQEAFDISYAYNRHTMQDDNSTHVEYYNEYNGDMKGLSVEAFDYIFPEFNLYDLDRARKEFVIGDLAYVLQHRGNNINIIKGEDIILTIDMEIILKKAQDHSLKQDLIEEFSYNGHTVKIIVQSISGKIDNGKYKIDHFDGVLLFK